MTANSDNCDNAFEMLEIKRKTQKPSSSGEDLDEIMPVHPEFQLVIENYVRDTKNKRSDVMVRSREDGYLHSEVGIDRELERLLAENPGLFMDEHSTKQPHPPPPPPHEQPPPPPPLPPQALPTLHSTDTGTITHESLTLHVSERYLNMSYFASFGCMHAYWYDDSCGISCCCVV